MSRMLRIILCITTAFCLSAGRLHVSNSATPLQIYYPDYFGNRITIPENNPATEEGVYLGKMLFYETALSANNLVSCATCHQQKLAFTDGKQFSTGFDGTLQPRNTMTLANLLWVRNFFWDGRANGLENQAEIPLTSAHEMGHSLEVAAENCEKK